MALTALSKVLRRNNQGNNTGAVADLTAAVKEVQRIRQKVVTGAAADANIAVTGIATADVIISVVNLTDETDLTSEASITSAGNIQLSDTSTAAKQLLVSYFDVA